MSKEKKKTVKTTEQESAPVVNEVTVEKTQVDGEDIPELSDEEIEFARLNFQKEFNERYSKWAVIADEKADDDFIAEAKNDLETASKVVTEKKYVLSGTGESLGYKTAELLRTWNTKLNKWTLNGWRGVLRFDKHINALIPELEADPEKALEVDYSTLCFLYMSMKEPSGTGLESSTLMGKFENYDEDTDAPKDTDAPVTYSGILERVFNHIREITAYDKKLNILKRRLDFAYGTARMDLKIDSVEEFVEFYNEITKSVLPESDKELKEVVAEAAAE